MLPKQSASLVISDICEVAMSVGSNIKKRRYEMRMSQQELADLLGYKTRSTISRIESGQNDVSQKKLQRIAEALDTTVEALVSDTYAAHAISPDAAAGSALSFSSGTDRKNKNVAVILAGGKSSRNNQNIPNQFINIHGKPVIVYCLEAYQAHPAIDDIYVVCLKGWEKIVLAYAEQYGITKLRGLVPAASSGILSVKSGLNFVKERYDSEDIIIFQEATRPMVSVDMISKLLQSCYENGSANICQSMKDYVQFKHIDNETEYIDRNSVVDLQSPEAYVISLLDEIFRTAAKNRHPLTESCCVMLMYNLGYPINFIEGQAHNPKIVHQEDIVVLEALISNRFF